MKLSELSKKINKLKKEIGDVEVMMFFDQKKSIEAIHSVSSCILDNSNDVVVVINK